MASFLPTFGRRGSGSSSVRAGQDPSSSSIASGSLFRVTTSGSVSGATTITAEKDALPGSTPTGAAAGAGASGPSPPAALAGGFSSSSLPEAERGIVGDLVRSLLSVPPPSRPSLSSRSFLDEPVLVRKIRALTLVAESSLSRVVEAIVTNLSSLIKDMNGASAPSAQARLLQSQLLLLHALEAVIPRAPSSSSSPLPPPYTFEPSVLENLVDVLSHFVSAQLSSGGVSRSSEDSGRGSAVLGRTSVLRHAAAPRHQSSASTSQRAGAFSPTGSSSSLPHPELSSTLLGGSLNVPVPKGSIVLALREETRQTACRITFAVSYAHWELVWTQIQVKLQTLASDPSDAGDLAELFLLGGCFVDRARLVQILQELSPVFLHIPRSAQAVAAQTLYINIHRWIRFDPSGWVDLYQSGRRFEGDPSSLFDVCFSIVGDSNTLSAQKAGTFWLVMTMLLALCPGLIERIVNGDNEGGRGSGSLGKKIQFVDTLQSSFYSARLANAAKRSCLDIVELASLLPRNVKFAGPKALVSEFYADLQEQLWYGKESQDLDLLASGLVLFYRKAPAVFSAKFMPRIMETSEFTKTGLARMCTLLAGDATTPDLRSDTALLNTIATSLRASLLGHRKTEALSDRSADAVERTLGPTELALINATLEAAFIDLQHLTAGLGPNTASAQELEAIFGLLASFLNAPQVELRATSASVLRLIHRSTTVQTTEADLLISSISAPTWWLPLRYASARVLGEGSQDDMTLLNDLEILNDMLDLACSMPPAAAQPSASTVIAIREGLARYELGMDYCLLSSNEDLYALARRRIDGWGGYIGKLVETLNAEGFSHEFCLEIGDVQERWAADQASTVDLLAKGPTGVSSRSGERPTVARLLPIRPAHPRIHPQVFLDALRRWERLDHDVRSGFCLPGSPDFETWRNLATFLCVVGASCANLPSRALVDGSIVMEQLSSFLQEISAELASENALLRSAVEGLLRDLDPRLLGTLVNCIASSVNSFFSAEAAPVLSRQYWVYIVHACSVLSSILFRVIRPVDANVGAVLIRFVDYLNRYSSTIPDLAVAPDDFAPPSTRSDSADEILASLASLCKLIEATVEKHELLSWKSPELLQTTLLDILSNWTSVTLEGARDDRLKSKMDHLDRSCLLAASVLTDKLVLKEGYRLGGTRARLSHRWLDIAQRLLEHQPATDTLGQLSSQPDLLARTICRLVSNILTWNPDITLEPCLALCYSKNHVLRAIFLQAVSTSTSALLSGPQRDPDSSKQHILLETLFTGLETKSFPGRSLLPSLWSQFTSIEHDALSELLLRQFEARGKSLHLLDALIKMEVDETSNASQIFRGTSLATKVYSAFARRHSQDYLRSFLRPFILAVVDEHPSARYEFDPSTAPRSEVNLSIRAVEALAQTLLDRLCSSATRAPALLRGACRILGKAVDARFEGLGRRAVSSLIMLRIISPLLVAPEAFSSHLDIPADLNKSGRRALVDVSKLLTNLANDLSLGKKEAHMAEFSSFRSDDNIAAMTAFLDDLQLVDLESLDLSSASATSQPLDARTNEDDESYLRLVLTSRSRAVCDSLRNHPRCEDVRRSLSGKMDRSLLSFNRELEVEAVGAANRAKRFVGFMDRSLARIVPDEVDRVFRDISTQDRRIYSIDLSALDLLDLDLVLYHVLSVLSLSEPYDLVFDCTGISHTTNIPKTWILEALKTIPDSVTSAARKVVLYCPNAAALQGFSRLSTLLALFDLHHVLVDVVAISSLASLAAHLDLDPNDLTIATALPVVDGPVFYEDVVDIISAQGLRRRATVALGPRTVSFQYHDNEFLKGHHGNSPLLIRDIYSSGALEDLYLMPNENGGRWLRIVIAGHPNIDVECKNSSLLEMSLSACLTTLSTRSSSPRAIEGVLPRLLLAGFLNISVLDNCVRAKAYSLLEAIETASPKTIPGLSRSRALDIPASAVELHQEFACGVASRNGSSSFIFIKEACQVYHSLVEGPQRTALLSLLSPWLRNLSGLRLQAMSASHRRAETIRVVRGLMKICFASSEPLRPEILSLWSQLDSLDPSLSDTAVHELVVKTTFSGCDSHTCQIISELLSVLASANTRGVVLATIRQLIEGLASQPASSQSIQRHPSWRQITILTSANLKLSFNSRSLPASEMFIPELFHVCLLSMSVNDKSQRAMIRGTLLNTIRATSTPPEASRAQVDRLLTVLSLDGPERPEEDDAALESPEGIVTAMARIDEMCETLVNVLIAIAVNADQANVWRARWTSLAVTSAMKPNTATRAVAFAALKMLGTGPGHDSNLLYSTTLDCLGKALTEFQKDGAGLVAMLSFLARLLPRLSSVSVLSCFWIGISIAQVDAIHLAAALPLVVGSLDVFLDRGLYPTSEDFVSAFASQSAALPLNNVAEDWGLRLESSLVFGMLTVLYKGLRNPITQGPSFDVLFKLLQLLLLSKGLSPAEELGLLIALSIVPARASLVEELYQSMDRNPGWDAVPLQESKLSPALLAFIVGPVLSSLPSQEQKIPLYELLVRASREIPSRLTSCYELLLPEIRRTIAAPTSPVMLLDLADALIPFVLSSPQSTADRIHKVLGRRGLQAILDCADWKAETASRTMERWRRLTYVASQLVKGEVWRVEEAED